MQGKLRIVDRLRPAIAATVLLAAGGTVATLIAQEPAPAPTEATRAATLVVRWTIIVTERFERSRAFKADSTDELFDQFMSRGAVQAVRDKAGEDTLRAADTAIDRFTTAAIRAGRRQEDGSVEVVDDSVAAAVKATCPVYPFC
jgi:hypothetical protein